MTNRRRAAPTDQWEEAIGNIVPTSELRLITLESVDVWEGSD